MDNKILKELISKSYEELKELYFLGWTRDDLIKSIKSSILNNELNINKFKISTNSTMNLQEIKKRINEILLNKSNIELKKIIIDIEEYNKYSLANILKESY